MSSTGGHPSFRPNSTAKGGLLRELFGPFLILSDPVSLPSLVTYCPDSGADRYSRIETCCHCGLKWEVGNSLGLPISLNLTVLFCFCQFARFLILRYFSRTLQCHYRTYSADFFSTNHFRLLFLNVLSKNPIRRKFQISDQRPSNPCSTKLGHTAGFAGLWKLGTFSGGIRRTQHRCPSTMGILFPLFWGP